MYHITYQGKTSTIAAKGETLEKAAENLATKLQKEAHKASDRAWTLGQEAVVVGQFV